MEVVLIVIFVFNVICAFVSGGINSSKGHSYVGGFLSGLFSGIFGIMAAIQRTTIIRKCPYCANNVYVDSTVCKHCRRDLLAATQVHEKTQISPEQFAGLTYRQKYAITEYGYLLSPEDAEIIGKMLADYKDKEIPSFCQAHGKRVGTSKT
jgi:hypothetical protein